MPNDAADVQTALDAYSIFIGDVKATLEGLEEKKEGSRVELEAELVEVSARIATLDASQ